jgi:hypothetical protein
MNDCNNISNLPTYLEHCWLNAIILCVLYSQHSRNFLINEIENLKTGGYMTLIKELLVSYYTNKKSIDKFFKEIDPSTLLFQIFNSKEKTKMAEQHIVNFYKYLGVKCAGIAYLKIDGKDAYITKEPITSQPDVIVFFHQDLNNYANKYLDNLKTTKNPKQLAILPNKFEGLSSYNNEIVYNGITYILSSCLTTDNRDNYEYHSVAGIYCNDTRYVYNGFYNKPKTPCSLIKYDWDITKNEIYCLNPKKCDIDVDTNIKGVNNLCFNFGNGNRTLVYIRKDKTTVLNNDKYKIEEFEKGSEEPKVDNFVGEIAKIKDLSIIGLLDEVEKIEKKHIDVSKISSSNLKRNNLERFILKHRLENLKEEVKEEEESKEEESKEEEVKEENKDKETEELLKDLEDKDTEKLLNELESETKKDEKIPEEKQKFETLGGKQITKKEILEKINSNLKKMKKDKLLSIYKQLTSR